MRRIRLNRVPPQPPARTSQFRHELKYLISYPEMRLLQERLRMFLQPDPHAEQGQYTIRSLYFDDFWGSAWADKLAGVDQRQKYRLRIYNYQDQVVHLECKEKAEAYINKSSAALNHSELRQLLQADYSFLARRPEPACRNFYTHHQLYQLQPAVIVDYEREPYIYPYGNVRVTFDRQVRAGAFQGDLFDAGLPVYEVLPPDQLILEVKYTAFLPEIVRSLLPIPDSAYTAASKYTLCMERKDKIMSLQGRMS